MFVRVITGMEFHHIHLLQALRIPILAHNTTQFYFLSMHFRVLLLTEHKKSLVLIIEEQKLKRQNGTSVKLIRSRWTNWLFHCLIA